MTTRRRALAGLVGPPLFAAIVLLVTAIEWDFLHDLGWSTAPFDSPDPPWPSSAALGDWGFLLLGLAVLALAVSLFRLLAARHRASFLLPLRTMSAKALALAARKQRGSR